MTHLNTLISLALKEDIGAGDITGNILIPAKQSSAAIIIAKEPGIIAGLELIKPIYHKLSNKVKVTLKKKDGARVKPGQVIAVIKGPTRALVTGERTVLNFLQRLSGIATLTRRFVDAADSYGVRILDTRKTVPGWRLLDKYAVKTGGGFNHRMGLYDGVLIKNNHLFALGGIKKLIWRNLRAPRLPVEIEARNLNEFVVALVILSAWAVRRPIIMLDNMSPDQIKKAVIIRNKINRRILLEASGGITLANIGKFAATEVDCISIGALTHSPKALDIALRIT